LRRGFRRVFEEVWVGFWVVLPIELSGNRLEKLFGINLKKPVDTGELAYILSALVKSVG
jgi:hypothetical protein